MPKIVIHLIQQSETRASERVGLDHNCRLFVGAGFLPHRVEDIVPLFDKISYNSRAETKGCKLLDDLIEGLLELWRVTWVRKQKGLAKVRDLPGGNRSHSP